MSQAAVAPKRHRATRSAAMPPAAPSSQNPQNPHHLNSHAYAQNSQVETNRPLQPTTPPRTPRRVDQFQQASQNLSSSAATEIASKQRSRNKNRPKNVMTSPAVTRNDRNTPPLTGANSAGMPTSAKPISTPSAYAGPTFHASPAPSALPIPSFYSKSVPDSPGMKGLQPRNGNSPTGPNSPSAPITQSTSQLHREESPLDFIFKADREEKARARSASSTLKSHDAAGPFPPPPQSPSNTPTPSRASQERARNRNSSNGIFAMEMDGPSSPGTPFGPAFSTPYAERINAARAATTPARPQTDPSQSSQQIIDKAEALKAYLFSGRPLPSSVTPNSCGGAGGAISSPRPNNLFSQEGNSTKKSGRSSGLRQEVTPTRTPTKTPDRNSSYAASPTPPSRVFGHSNVPHYNDFMGKFNSHTNSPTTGSPSRVSSGGEGTDLRGMEESLRKILKLEPTNNSGVIGAGIGNVPGASVSVPNYVGGRQPPMDGMHNGVMGS